MLISAILSIALMAAVYFLFKRESNPTQAAMALTLELVGLLLNEEPVVYISDELPRMEKVRKMPTRPLNGFEATGLKSLQHGEDVFIRESAETLRMLGAIRCVVQCSECHGAKRGDLLGAFSYRLQRVR